MKKQVPEIKQSDKLRLRAEEQLYKKTAPYVQDMQTVDIMSMVHELQVHQIELEMQNEELRFANSQAENALNKYYELYDFAPAGYFTINEHGLITEANMSGAELLGVKKQYLLNNYFQNFVSEDCLSAYKAFSTKVFETGTKHKCEIRLLKSRNIPFYTQIQGITVKDDNNSERQIRISVFDITDRVEAEQLKVETMKLHEVESDRLLNETLAFDKLKTEFFSNLSHELRTPLNVIFGTLQLLELKKSNLQTETGIKLGKQISIIKQNCLRLLRLINNIIDITKIESGFFEIHLHNNNIISIIEDVTLSVAEYIENKGIALQFDTDVEEKQMAYDPDKIERVMLNLLSNALKFTNPGGSIFVNIYDRGECIEISVKDTGKGIPKEKLEEIFQRFKQVDMSLTKQHEGSGIGLSLVKSLVEMHGGTLSVESEVGTGSEFIIRLPVKILQEKSATSENTGDGVNKIHIDRLKIEFSDIYSESRL